MKTINDLKQLIAAREAAITALDNEKRGGAYEEWATRQKIIRKARGKHMQEIKRMRRLILFVERVPEEGVQVMRDKLQKEIAAATATAHRMFDKGNTKRLIREYLTTVGIPLKKKQIKELEFLLK